MSYCEVQGSNYEMLSSRIDDALVMLELSHVSYNVWTQFRYKADMRMVSA